MSDSTRDRADVLVVNPAVPAKNVAEFIEYGQEEPGEARLRSAGYGTSPQMSFELFKAMTGTFIVHIPFRGSGPAQAAMPANETQMMFDNCRRRPRIRSGKVRALAVTGLTRSACCPSCRRSTRPA